MSAIRPSSWARLPMVVSVSVIGRQTPGPSCGLGLLVQTEHLEWDHPRADPAHRAVEEGFTFLQTSSRDEGTMTLPRGSLLVILQAIPMDDAGVERHMDDPGDSVSPAFPQSE